MMHSNVIRTLVVTTLLAAAGSLSGCWFTCGEFCEGEGFGAPVRDLRVLHGVPSPAMGLVLGTDVAGLSPSLAASLDVPAFSLQSRFVGFTLPPGFGFNGFQALGPEPTQIGLLGYDRDLDGRFEVVLPIRASSPANFAAIDFDRDGRYTPGVDADVNVGTAGSITIDTTVPFGGDGRAFPAYVPFGYRVTLVFYPGLFTNPGPGMHPIPYLGITVDPDTGDADDGANHPPVEIAGSIDAAIAPSPLAALDDFLCYKAKLTGGRICRADAPANAGAACRAESECGGTEGTTTFCAKNAGPTGARPRLADPFADKPYAVAKPVSLCVPADESGAGLHDAGTHLRGYKLKEGKRRCAATAPTNPGGFCASAADCGGASCEPAPKHARIAALAVQNRLGTVLVDVVKPVGLLVPSASGDAPVGPPAAADVDHYTCYTVKAGAKVCAGDRTVACKRNEECGIDGPCLARFPKRLAARVDDRFTVGDKAFALKKPTRLCTATGRDGAPAAHADAHLLCYQAKALKKACTQGSPGIVGAPCKTEEDCGVFFPPVPTSFCRPQPASSTAKGLHVANGLAVERLDVQKELELCVPSVLP